MYHEKQRSNLWSKKEIIFGVLGIVLTITLGFLAVHFSNELKNLESVSKYGLAGLFLLAFITCSALSITPIAIPYWAVTLTLPTVLAPQYGIWAPVLVAYGNCGCGLFGSIYNLYDRLWRKVIFGKVEPRLRSASL